jgi:hypothetical protein
MNRRKILPIGQDEHPNTSTQTQRRRKLGAATPTSMSSLGHTDFLAEEEKAK